MRRILSALHSEQEEEKKKKRQCVNLHTRVLVRQARRGSPSFRTYELRETGRGDGDDRLDDRQTGRVELERECTDQR